MLSFLGIMNSSATISFNFLLASVSAMKSLNTINNFVLFVGLQPSKFS